MQFIAVKAGPYKPRTGHTGQCMNMHRPNWPHWPYTVYMVVLLYTKQGAVKLSQILMKSMHRPYRLPQQSRIAHRTAQTLIRYNDPIDYKGENGQQ